MLFSQQLPGDYYRGDFDQLGERGDCISSSSTLLWLLSCSGDWKASVDSLPFQYCFALDGIRALGVRCFSLRRHLFKGKAKSGSIYQGSSINSKISALDLNGLFLL